MPTDHTAVPSDEFGFVLGRHRMTLRSATLKKRSVFRFLDLPGEMRNMIYEILLDYGSVSACFDRYVRLLEESKAPKEMLPPSVNRTVPSILLLNREIYNEAVGVLRSKPLVLTHGLIEQQLPRVITGPTLRTITHLVITDTGHPILDRRYPNSFGGFQKLAYALKQILKSDHKLKTFELHLTDADLAWHVEHCWDSVHRCDMKKWVHAIVQSLRQIRGIEKVIIEGYLPQCFKDDLVNSMQSNSCPILRLPQNVRNKIYGYALDCNNASGHSYNILGLPLALQHQAPHPMLTTPTILLLNRQITAEALNVLAAMRPGQAMYADDSLMNLPEDDEEEDLEECNMVLDKRA